MPILVVNSYTPKVLPAVFWRERLTYAGSTPTIIQIDSDSSGNVYVLRSSSPNSVLTAQAPTGTILWARQITSSVAVTPRALKVQGSSLYVLSQCTVASTVNNSAVAGTNLMKYDLNGNLLWKAVYGAGASALSASNMTIDVQGNIVFCSTSPTYLVKVEPTAGALVWKFQLTGSLVGHQLACDSASNIFVQAYDSSSSYTALLGFNSSGALLRAQKIITAGFTFGSMSLAVDHSDNLWSVSKISQGSNLSYNWLVDKFDPSGNLVFEQLWRGGTNLDTLTGGIVVGTDNNIYGSLGFNNVYTPHVLASETFSVDQNGGYGTENAVSTNAVSTSQGVQLNLQPALGVNAIFTAGDIVDSGTTHYNTVIKLPVIPLTLKTPTGNLQVKYGSLTLLGARKTHGL